MINSNAHIYSEPVQVGALWVITETDVVTGETAEFGYPTQAFAQATYQFLIKPETADA